jgi:hypothetical protein
MLKRLCMMALLGFACLVVSGGTALASSHREAPLISQDPEADLTDVYAWVDQHDAGRVNLIMNAVPLELPSGAPTYYGFGTNVRYDFNVDRNGDGRPDVTYRFQFKRHVRNGGTFLYNLGAVNSITSANLNVHQTYTVWKITWHDGHGSSKVVARNVPVVPNNVGPKSMPNFAALVSQGVKHFGRDGAGKVWAGQADDPFFLDLGGIGDLLHIRAQGTAPDAIAGFNVQSVAVQVPKQWLVGKSPTIGIWSGTQRRNINVLSGGGFGSWKQVERLGNPLINEVLIPLAKKDRWAQATPRHDSQFNTYLLNPGLAGLLGAPATGRTDVLAVLHTGVKGLNFTGPHFADELRLNTSIAPSANPNPLGVLAGDTAGFPNGRRLADNVTDIELKVLAGALLGKDTSGVSQGVTRNDVPFTGSFPYLGIAHSGFEAIHQLPTP